MTIEEKAKEFAGYNRLSLQDIVTCSMMDEWQKYEGFKAGAEWMLENAVRWLKANAKDFSDNTDELIKQFEEAMEE